MLFRSVRDSDWTPARSAEPCDPVSRPVSLTPVPQPFVTVPAPQPVTALAPMPVKAAMQKISFSADALFAFDKSVLKPEGKLMLDGLVTQLKGVTDDGIVLTGHTDRFGTSAYNQKLSERRANAVKEYLVARGLPATSILAEGKGETQPDTKPGDCKGARSTKTISCLQPDRRVDVEMQGNKMVSQSR